MKKYNSLIQLLRGSSTEAELNHDNQQKIFRQISSKLRPRKQKRWPKLSLFFKSLAFAVFLLVITSALVLIPKPDKVEQNKKEEILAKLQLVQQVSASSIKMQNPLEIASSKIGQLYEEEMIIDYLDPYVCSELLLGNDTYEPGYVPKQSLPIYSFSTYYINYDGEVGMINSSNSDGELTSMNYHDLRLSYFYNGGDYIALTSYPEEVTNANLSYLKESIDAQKEIEAGEPGEVYFQGGYRETFDDLGNNNYKITYWYGDLCPEGSRLEVLYFNDVEQTLRYETYINEEKPENLYYRFNKTYSLEDATYESALEKINIAVQLPKDKSIREFDFIDLGFTNYYGGGNASNFKIVSEVINKFKFPYLLSANSEFRVNQIYFGDWWDQYTSTLSRPQYWNDPLFYPVADRVHILVQPRFMIFNPSGEAESYESLAELMAKSELASIHLQRKDEEYNYHGFGIHIYSDEIDMTSGEIVTSYLSYSNLEFSEDLTINIDGELAVFKLYKGYVWNGDDTYGQTGQYLLIGEFTPGYQAVIIPEGESADIYEIAKLDFTVKDPAKVDDLDYLIMLAKETYP